MYYRAEAAGHGEHVTRLYTRRAADRAVVLQRTNFSRTDAFLTIHLANDVPFQHGNAPRFNLGSHSACAAGANIDERGDVDTRITQVERRLVRVVVISEHHCATTGRDSKLIHVSRHRPAQHHAWAIVVTEHERTLERTRRNNDMFGTYTPHALARDVLRRRGEMVCASLD